LDAIDEVVMNSRLHYLGMDARVIEPRMKLAVLTCMDARVDAASLLGLRPGDAHVIRNAGGRATREVMNAFAVSQGILGTREIMVIHHTECALQRFTETQLAEGISTATHHPFTELLGCFTDPIEAIRDDVQRLIESKSLVHRDKIRGFLYDLATNSLAEVEMPPVVPQKPAG